MDLTIFLLLCLCCASFTTLHVTLAFAVGQRLGKVRGWLALLGGPLAPYFGIIAGKKVASVAWWLLLVSYGVLLFLATR